MFVVVAPSLKLFHASAFSFHLRNMCSIFYARLWLCVNWNRWLCKQFSSIFTLNVYQTLFHITQSLWNLTKTHSHIFSLWCENHRCTFRYDIRMEVFREIHSLGFFSLPIAILHMYKLIRRPKRVFFLESFFFKAEKWEWKNGFGWIKMDWELFYRFIEAINLHKIATQTRNTQFFYSERQRCWHETSVSAI